MASTYNSRPLTPEVLVDGDSAGRWCASGSPLEALIERDSVPDWLG